MAAPQPLVGYFRAPTGWRPHSSRGVFGNSGHAPTVGRRQVRRTPPTRSLLHGRTGRAQILAALDDALGHVLLGRLAPGTRVVLLLVADLAVHLEHALVVAQPVVGDRAGERVLRVGVYVHLHHAVVQGGPDLLQQRAGAAVEDQVERLLLAVLRADRLLDLLEDLRAQLHVARLVHAVHVAEGQRGDVAALLAQAERRGGGQAVARGGVQLLVDRPDDAVLLATDDADLDLQDHLRVLADRQQLLGDLQVLVQRHGRAVPHVRLEQRLVALGDALPGDLQQRPDETVELVLRAVVGVQGDVDRVLLRHLVGVRGQRHRAGDHVLDGRAGQVLGTAGGDLDDPVALRLGEAAQRGVEGLRAGDVDGGVRERAGLGAVEHLAVNVRGSDGHRLGSLVVVRVRRLRTALSSPAVSRRRPPYTRPTRALPTR